jgi:Rap1a immunity proteins
MQKQLLAVAMFLVLTVTPFDYSVAQDEFQLQTSGNAFLALCTQQNSSYQACIWYVIGYSDGLSFTNAALTSSATNHCTANGTNLMSNVTGVQMVDMVLGYLHRYPQQRHLPMPKLIVDTFREAWPCP